MNQSWMLKIFTAFVMLPSLHCFVKYGNKCDAGEETARAPCFHIAEIEKFTCDYLPECCWDEVLDKCLKVVHSDYVSVERISAEETTTVWHSLDTSSPTAIAPTTLVTRKEAVHPITKKRQESIRQQLLKEYRMNRGKFYHWIKTEEIHPNFVEEEISEVASGATAILDQNPEEYYSGDYRFW